MRHFSRLQTGLFLLGFSWWVVSRVPSKSLFVHADEKFGGLAFQAGLRTQESRDGGG